MVKMLILGLVVASGTALASPFVQGTEPAGGNTVVPAQFQGVWGRNGRCDIAADRLRMTAHRAGWGAGPLKPVVYSADDRTVGWDSEYDAAAFEIGGYPNMLVYNRDGGGMPGARDLYVRCRPGMKRMPVPR